MFPISLRTIQIQTTTLSGPATLPSLIASFVSLSSQLQLDPLRYPLLIYMHC